MRDEQKAKQFVAELHNLGFKFALDDFGSGYSSFYYLKNLDVDYIKIDGEFIKNIDNSPEDRHFVKALTDLAKGLNVEIIAEFVENQTHVNILKEMGVDYMQGYHISKPIDSLDSAVKNFDEKFIDQI
jgi:EAL domain-containing protein (putative c-di-GMP-specific phosphodiesterase class I)